MVDLVGIGVSGLAAYQKALATTGNNIANLQTAGYVRQRSTIESAGQDNSARISLGAGVRFAGVERLYDRYLEENLRRSGGDFKSQEALLSQLQQLQDSVGSSTAGLHGAFQAFFDSARMLESSPGSTGARTGFLAAANGVASRFQGLSRTVADMQSATRAQIEQAVDEVNVRLKELGTLNAQLIKRSTDAEQPMQLLDRRDTLLKELSERMGVAVSLGNSGAADIYAGDSTSGAALVEGGTVHAITAQFDDIDPGRVQFVLDASTRPMVLPTATTGTLGGLTAFRGQALGPVADSLDQMALAFGTAINDIQRKGLDAAGHPGQPLFYVGPKYSVTGDGNSGKGRLAVTIEDPQQVAAHTYSARFDTKVGQWTVKDLSSGLTANGTDSVHLGGLLFSFQGAPKDGDAFIIRPESRPAQTMAVLIEEPGEVATASRISAQGALSNLSSIGADAALTSPRSPAEFRTLQTTIARSAAPPYSSTLFSASSRPITVITAGTQNVSLRADGSVGELAVFTRDGRQLSGPTLTAAQGAALVSTANGFYAGAVINASYNGKVGSQAYLDQPFSYGATAIRTAQRIGEDGSVVTEPKITSSRIDSAGFGGIAANGIRINGQPVSVELPAGSSAKDIAALLNAQSAVTGVSVKASNAISIAVPDSVPAGSRQSLTINGSEFVGDDVESLLHNINTSGMPHITARLEASGIVIADSTGADMAVTGKIGNATVGDVAKTGGYLTFESLTQAASITVDINSEAVSSGNSGDAAALTRQLGLTPSFNMQAPLAEDLLVFGIGADGNPGQVSLSGTYDVADVPADQMPDARTYDVSFGSNSSYSITDVATGTVVSEGQFDPVDRAIRYGNWTLNLSGIPATGDRFTVQPTQDPLGDNRNASALVQLQDRTDVMTGQGTFQQNYETLVNRVGSLSVQAEVSRNAQQVMLDHATQARDRVSGVNLDEELADLLRFQQAYQANAQVIQAASKLFDSLMQRL